MRGVSSAAVRGGKWWRAWSAAAGTSPPSPPRVLRGAVLGAVGGGGAHSMAVDEGGRVIDNEVARAPFPPHSRWQEAADALAAGLPTLSEAWWVLLPGPAQVAATHGQPTGLARLPAGHHTATAHAEVRRLAGGFEEGAAAQIQAAGRGQRVWVWV